MYNHSLEHVTDENHGQLFEPLSFFLKEVPLEDSRSCKYKFYNPRIRHLLDDYIGQ